MDFILIGILLVVVGLAVFYVVRAKKKGVKCIGCPNAGKCASCNGACGSSSEKPDK
jgi:hypothetical protein